MQEVTFERRFQGPFGSVNGGYLAGVLGEAVGPGASTTRLDSPVPLDTPLDIVEDEAGVSIRGRGQTYATATSSDADFETAQFASEAEIRAADRIPFETGIFADCFVCGLPAPTGLGVDPRPLSAGRFGAIWQPARSALVEGPVVAPRLLHAALDCPGGFAAITAAGRLALTGTITSRIEFLPPADETLLIVAQAGDVNGRKLGAVTTIFNAEGDVVASAEAIWIAMAAA
jgi:acyl-coenzyme A thioesterase PaaI-like protein